MSDKNYQSRGTRMRVRGVSRMLGVAALTLLAVNSTFAGPISGCVLNNDTSNGRQHQTCTLFETDAQGNFSETSSIVTSLLGNNWDPLIGFLSDGPDQATPGALSDILVFTSNTVQLFSNGSPAFDALLATIVNVREFRTETGPNAESSPFTNGLFTRGVSTDPNDDDVFFVISTPNPVAEPGMLALMMMGVGSVRALRRRAS